MLVYVMCKRQDLLWSDVKPSKGFVNVTPLSWWNRAGLQDFEQLDVSPSWGRLCRSMELISQAGSPVQMAAEVVAPFNL